MNSEALRLLDEMDHAASYIDMPPSHCSAAVVAYAAATAKLRAHLSAQEPGWRPIETAPRDGTAIIVYRPIHDGNYIPMVGIDHVRMRPPYEGVWGRSRNDTPPVAWMPLPAPPGEHAKQEAK